MRRYTSPLLAALITGGAVLVIAASGCQRAQALESFDLGERDRIIAEAPNCKVECRAVGSFRRTCMIRDPDCKAVCQDFPECNVMGKGTPKVCAIMRVR